MKKLIAWFIRFVPRKYLQRVAGAGVRILAVIYMGKGVTCPVCEKSYRKFLPYGRLRPRENALCPSCLSLERHRLIWLYLRERTKFFARAHKVLHIAPEACFIKRFERIHGDGYVTADLESPLARVRMDIHKMPFADNSFDVVLCNHVLEHVTDDIQAMREIGRVLKPGGFSILQVPFFFPLPPATFENHGITDPKERERIFGQDDHVRRYGPDYANRIAAAGLHAVEDDFVNTKTQAEQARFGLVPGEIIFRGNKP